MEGKATHLERAMEEQKNPFHSWACEERALGRLKALPREREVSNLVLKTEPDSQSNKTMRGTFRDKVRGPGNCANIRMGPH